MINKIFICSTNVSGKAFLLSLLDGHEDNAIYPFHKFGLSNQVSKFYNYLTFQRYPVYKGFFNTDKKFVVPIKSTENNIIYDISFGELLYYIIKEFDSMPFLLQSHFTKTCVNYSGDKNKSISNFNFNFNLFIDLFFEKFNEFNSEYFSLEDIDNFLYKSFIQTLSNNSKIEKKKNIVLYGANGPKQIENLFEYYENFKILFIKRDPLGIGYTNSKRILSKEINDPSEKLIFNLMRKSSKQQLKKINESFQSALSYSKFSDKIKIINFEELVTDTSKIMLEISEFIKIKFDDILINPTNSNKDMGINHIVDDPHKLLNSKFLFRLDNIYNNKKNKSFRESLFYLYDQIYIAISNNKFLNKILRIIRGK